MRIVIILFVFACFGCSSSSKSFSSKRGLMLLDTRELPRNAIMNSKKYNAKLKKSHKTYRKATKKAIRRSMR